MISEGRRKVDRASPVTENIMNCNQDGETSYKLNTLSMETFTNRLYTQFGCELTAPMNIHKQSSGSDTYGTQTHTNTTESEVY